MVRTGGTGGRAVLVAERYLGPVLLVEERWLLPVDGGGHADVAR